MVQLIVPDRSTGDRPDDALLPLYRELRSLASDYLGRMSPGQTLQPTAIVHEAYLRLANNDGLAWRSKSHFFAISAKTMRAVLLDHVRRSRAEKRGGGAGHVTLSGLANDPEQDPGVDLVALSDALDELARLDPRQAEVVELRFFAGMSVAAVAAQLEVSERTVKNDWRMAKAWLRVRLEDDDAATDA